MVETITINGKQFVKGSVSFNETTGEFQARVQDPTGQFLRSTLQSRGITEERKVQQILKDRGESKFADITIAKSTAEQIAGKPLASRRRVARPAGDPGITRETAVTKRRGETEGQVRTQSQLQAEKQIRSGVGVSKGFAQLAQRSDIEGVRQQEATETFVSRGRQFTPTGFNIAAGEQGNLLVSRQPVQRAPSQITDSQIPNINIAQDSNFITRQFKNFVNLPRNIENVGFNLRKTAGRVEEVTGTKTPIGQSLGTTLELTGLQTSRVLSRPGTVAIVGAGVTFPALGAALAISTGFVEGSKALTAIRASPQEKDIISGKAFTRNIKTPSFRTQLEGKEKFKQAVRVGLEEEVRGKDFIGRTGEFLFFPDVFKTTVASTTFRRTGEDLIGSDEAKFIKGVESSLKAQGLSGEELTFGIAAARRQRIAGVTGGTAGLLSLNTLTEIGGTKRLKELGLLGTQIKNVKGLKGFSKVATRIAVPIGKEGIIEGAVGEVVISKARFEPIDFKKTVAAGAFGGSFAGAVGGFIGATAATTPSVSKAVLAGARILDPFEYPGDVLGASGTFISKVGRIPVVVPSIVPGPTTTITTTIEGKAKLPKVKGIDVAVPTPSIQTATTQNIFTPTFTSAPTTTPSPTPVDIPTPTPTPTVTTTPTPTPTTITLPTALTTPTTTPTPTPTTIPVVVPTLKIPGLPLLPGGGGGAGRGRGFRFRLPKGRFTPSLTAFALGIRGTKPKVSTGLFNIRPITKEFKVPKKRKAKKLKLFGNVNINMGS